MDPSNDRTAGEPDARAPNTESRGAFAAPGMLSVLSTVFEQSAEGIVVCDPSARILFVNPAFESVTGYNASEVIGQTPRILQSGRQDAAFYRDMWSALRVHGRWSGEIVNRRKDGELYTEFLTVRAVYAGAAVTHYVGVFTDITEHKRAQQRVEQLTNFDPLTELPNRSLFSYRLDQLLSAARATQSGFTLLFIDLDRFKTINDSVGHEAGDLLLKMIASRLTSIVRRTDIVARLGGDEFAIALPGLATRAEAGCIAEQVLSEMARPLTLVGQELSVTGSIGVCMCPDDAVDAGEMIRRADSAMYEAKRSGRNTFRFCASGVSEDAREVLAIDSALRRALQRGEFVLFYQPQIDLASGAVIGAEALIRWKRPNAGLMLPAQFIPIAEERGLISAIGEWTLKEAVRQAAAWRTSGLQPLSVAVNISATQFHQPHFVEGLLDLIRAHALSPQQLRLEITESVILKDAEATIDRLRQLHGAGVHLSIDDFGTGYSSLNYLRRFPINEIKIDRSFVHEMADDPGAVGIVRGIVALARNLNLRAMAEGVETFGQLETLRALKCDAAQGFLMSRPIPAEEFELLVQGWAESREALFGRATRANRAEDPSTSG